MPGFEVGCLLEVDSLEELNMRCIKRVQAMLKKKPNDVPADFQSTNQQAA